MTLLILRAYVLLLSFERALARGEFTRVYRRVRDRACRPSPSNANRERACRAVNIACALYFQQVQCLQRSAVVVCLLRDLGIPATLVIGAQRLPFRAHAWVEVNGQVVNDSESSVQLYGVLDRI